MNPTPKGKIDRLPKAIQDEVNRRMQQNQKGTALVAWLNSLPEVQTLLAAEFKGRPIREQNLSDWRKHGYPALFRSSDTANDPIADLPPSGKHVSS